jgi:hypothetical protein
MANLALRIAREYNYAWQFSPLVPAGKVAEWREEDPRPTLAAIEASTPKAIFEPHLDHIMLRFRGGVFHLRFINMTGHTQIDLRVSEDGRWIERAVTIMRNNGHRAAGLIVDGETFTEADPSAWHERHVDQWVGAWQTHGVEPPPFPGEVTATRFIYGRDPWPDDPAALETATIYLPEWAAMTTETLRTMLRHGDKVIICDRDLDEYPIGFVEYKW